MIVPLLNKRYPMLVLEQLSISSFDFAAAHLSVYSQEDIIDLYMGELDMTQALYSRLDLRDQDSDLRDRLMEASCMIVHNCTPDHVVHFFGKIDMILNEHDHNLAHNRRFNRCAQHKTHVSPAERILLERLSRFPLIDGSTDTFIRSWFLGLKLSANSAVR